MSSSNFKELKERLEDAERERSMRKFWKLWQEWEAKAKARSGAARIRAAEKAHLYGVLATKYTFKYPVRWV